jgi:FixJ family two-component response regulator
MNVEREREHLVQADRHIAECKQYIARQREIIQRMAQDGHSTELAESLLDALEVSLRAFERHRQLILDRLDI